MLGDIMPSLSNTVYARNNTKLNLLIRGINYAHVEYGFTEFARCEFYLILSTRRMIVASTLLTKLYFLLVLS